MTDALNGKTVLVGAGLAGLTWRFTRPSADTATNYTNASISVRFFELDKKFKPISTTPALSLSIGSAIAHKCPHSFIARWLNVPDIGKVLGLSGA